MRGSSKNKKIMQQVADYLEENGFKVNRYFDYKFPDKRLKKGYNIINRIELNGHTNFENWINHIGTNQAKNLIKINQWKKKSSEGRI